MATTYEFWDPTPSSINFSGPRWLAQTFKSSVTHAVTAVKLRYFTSMPGSYIVSIQNVDGNGEPDGTNIDGTTVTVAAGAEWVTYTFPQPITVLANVTYAIVQNPNGITQHRHYALLGYPNGATYRSDDGTAGSWTANVGASELDFLFYEEGNVLSRDDISWSGAGTHLAVAASYSPFMTWYSHDGFGDRDIASDVLERFSMGRGRDSVRQLAPSIAGYGDFDLDNLANTYDPGKVLRRGLPIQVKVTWNSVEYTVFTGQIEDLVQHPELDRREVSIEALGVFNKLVGKKVSTELYSNIRVDTAIGHVLDAVGWPPDDRTLDVAKTTLDWWWLDDEDAFEALRTLVQTEGPLAALVEGGDGKIQFHDREHLADQTVSNTIQATFRDTGASPRYTKPFEYDDGLLNVINEAVVTVKTRSANAETDIWLLGVAGTQIVLTAFEPKTYLVRHTSGDPFTAAVTPVAGTDYTLVAGTLDAVTLSRTSGGNALLTLTAGLNGATVDDLKVRAQRVEVDTETQIANTGDAAESQNRHGVQSYPFDIRAEIGEEEARGFCNVIVSGYKDGRPTVKITVPNLDTATLEAALARDVGHRIRVIETNHSIDHEYWVQKIQHNVRKGFHEVVLLAEQADKAYGAIPLIWDTGKWDESAWWY